MNVEDRHRLAAMMSMERFQAAHGLTGAVVKEITGTDRVDFIATVPDGRRFGIGCERGKSGCQ